jgi:hypothetical protein
MVAANRDAPKSSQQLLLLLTTNSKIGKLASFFVHVRVWIYIKTVVFLILPAVAGYFVYFSRILHGQAAETDSQDGASASWWFYLCPPSANFQSALGMQAFIIDSPWEVVMRLGLCYLIITAKGWPFIVFWWGT